MVVLSKGIANLFPWLSGNENNNKRSAATGSINRINGPLADAIYVRGRNHLYEILAVS